MEYINLDDWLEKRFEVRYSRTYVKNGYVRTWHNLVYHAHNLKDAQNIVNEWNRMSVLQHEQHPDMGMWVYVEEK